VYTKKILPVKSVLRWTRGHVVLFLALATIPVLLYDVVGFKWLHVPWLPLSVVGTAVAFIVGFKNNASYDRLWEARKIWGGIVNASRSFTVMVKDFIVNDQLTAEELSEIHRELVHRHVAWLTALRYQLRTMRPWENKRDSEDNQRLPGMTIRILESEVPIDEAIADYISPVERGEIFNKGNQASQLLGIQSSRLRELRQQESLGVIVTDHSSAEGYGLMHSMWLFFGTHFVWFSIPFSAIVSWVFFALEIAGEHSENPFEGGPNDVPITDLSRSIEIDIRQLIKLDMELALAEIIQPIAAGTSGWRETYATRLSASDRCGEQRSGRVDSGCDFRVAETTVRGSPGASYRSTGDPIRDSDRSGSLEHTAEDGGCDHRRSG
jgi:predicted membrane chloride channel (bestrophin family)